MDNLIFELIALAMVLISKFWPVILAYVLYQLFSSKVKQAKKQGTTQPRRTVVYPPIAEDRPFEDRPFEYDREPQMTLDWEPPDFHDEPAPVVEEKRTTAVYSSPVANVTNETGLYTEERSSSVSIAGDYSSSPATVAITKEPPVVDPREGMKWALIFSPPRAKSPHRSPYRS